MIYILTLLALASNWKALQFGFFQDDYFFLWNALYDPFVQFINFKHPGTPLEIFIFIRLFGLNPLLWGLFGIGLKVCTAYLSGIFFAKLTGSRRIGILSSLFVAVSLAGLTVVTSIGYHLPVLVANCILLSLIFLLKSLQNKENYFRLFIIFISIGIFLDPARALPTLCIPPLILYLFPKTKKVAAVENFLKKFYIGFFFIGFPILTFWFFTFSMGKDAQILQVSSVKMIGNLFASITNLFIEVFYRIDTIGPKFETANYQRIFGVIGVCITLGILAYRRLPFISFCLFWIIIYFLPNWIAEPRIPMTSQNHYQFISSVGYAGLIAYFISRIKKIWLVVLLSFGFVAMNIIQSNIYLAARHPYRAGKVIDQSMRVILQTTQIKQPNVLFFFTGDIPWFENSLYWDLGQHYLLLTKNGNISHLPQITFDETHVLEKLCAPSTTRDFLARTVYFPQLPVSNIYSWNVVAPGILLDTTTQMRKDLESQAAIKGCTTLP